MTALVEVEDLVMHCPRAAGVVANPGGATRVDASRSGRDGETFGLVGESGPRQDDARASCSGSRDPTAGDRG